MTTILYTSPKNIQIDDKGEPFIDYDEDYIISYKEGSDKIYALKMVEFANAKSQRKIDLKKEYNNVYENYFIPIVYNSNVIGNTKQIVLNRNQKSNNYHQPQVLNNMNRQNMMIHIDQFRHLIF